MWYPVLDGGIEGEGSLSYTPFAFAMDHQLDRDV